MGILIALGGLVLVYVAERTTSYVRRARVEQRRANAEYPLTDHNDPVGRTIA